MSDKCEVNGIKISPCAPLSKALEYGNPRTKSKGAFIPERINTKTGVAGTDIAQLHSGEYVGRGVAMHYCPFCGESLQTWTAQEQK